MTLSPESKGPTPFVTMTEERTGVQVDITLREEICDPGWIGIVVCDLVRHLALAVANSGLADGHPAASEIEASIWEWVERERDNPTDKVREVVKQ